MPILANQEAMKPTENITLLVTPTIGQRQLGDIIEFYTLSSDHRSSTSIMSIPVWSREMHTPKVHSFYPKIIFATIIQKQTTKHIYKMYAIVITNIMIYSIDKQT